MTTKKERTERRVQLGFLRTCRQVYNEVKHLPDANNTIARSEADVFLHI